MTMMGENQSTKHTGVGNMTETIIITPHKFNKQAVIESTIMDVVAKTLDTCKENQCVLITVDVVEM